MSRGALVGILGVMVAVTTARAQDTTRVDLRLLYDNPRVRPGLVVLPAAGLDSVRAILERDLDQSDRFEMILLPSVMLLAQPGPQVHFEHFALSLYRTLLGLLVQDADLLLEGDDDSIPDHEAS